MTRIEETEGWDEFVAAVRKDTVQAVASSSFVMSLVPFGGKADIKFAVELGLAIMADKPIVALAVRGEEVPPGLRRIAHAVIELEHDMDTAAGRKEMDAKLRAVMASLGMPQ